MTNAGTDQFWFGKRWQHSSGPIRRYSEVQHFPVFRFLVGSALTDMLESRDFTERCLQHADWKMRRVALDLLFLRWHPPVESLQIVEELARSDPFHRNRAGAVRILGSAYKNSGNERICSLVSAIVGDPSCDDVLRDYAAGSLMAVRGLDADLVHQRHVGRHRLWARRDAPLMENLGVDERVLRDGGALGSAEIDWPAVESLWNAFDHGLTAFRQAEFFGAIEHYTTVIDRVRGREPWRGFGYILRGCARGNLGRLDAAIADFTASIEQDPEDPDAFRERSEAYRRINREDEATNDDATANLLEQRLLKSRLRRGYPDR